jgi:hypothetical protein
MGSSPSVLGSSAQKSGAHGSDQDEVDPLPGEDDLKVPQGWSALVHPRRGGIRPGEPTLSEQDRARFNAAWDARRPRIEAILADPDTDPSLVSALQSRSDTVLRAGVIAAMTCYMLPWDERPVLVDQWVVDHGPAFAALALEESAGLVVGGDFAVLGRPRGPFLRRMTGEDEPKDRALRGSWPWTRMAKRLRVHLALVPDDVHQSVVEALAIFRNGLLRQRILATYLAPERRDWFEQDLTLPDSPNVPKDLLFYAADTVERHCCVGAVDAAPGH